MAATAACLGWALPAASYIKELTDSCQHRPENTMALCAILEPQLLAIACMLSELSEKASRRQQQASRQATACWQQWTDSRRSCIHFHRHRGLDTEHTNSNRLTTELHNNMSSKYTGQTIAP
jgi:hypothetical protein